MLERFDTLFLVMFMKNKKVKKGIQFLLFIGMIYAFIYLGTKEYITQVTDNIRFSNDYKDISKNNVYKYVGEHEVLEILNGKSGILFLGFPSNIWSHYYADYLNEVAINNNIEAIYYYDFKRDRSMNNVTYNSIVQKLAEYMIADDTGNKDLFAPTILIIKNGKILYFEDEILYLKGDISPEDYFTEMKKREVKEQFDMAIKNYLGSDQL